MDSSTLNDWAVNTMASAIQETHDDCIRNPDSCHMTLSKMYSDSQSAADRKSLKEQEDAAKEDAESMEKKMKKKNKKKSPLDSIDPKWLLAGAALLYFMRR